MPVKILKESSGYNELASQCEQGESDPSLFPNGFYKAVSSFKSRDTHEQRNMGSKRGFCSEVE